MRQDMENNRSNPFALVATPLPRHGRSKYFRVVGEGYGVSKAGCYHWKVLVRMGVAAATITAAIHPGEVGEPVSPTDIADACFARKQQAMEMLCDGLENSGMNALPGLLCGVALSP